MDRDEREATLSAEYRWLIREAFRIGGLGWATTGLSRDAFNKRSAMFDAEVSALAGALDEAKADSARLRTIIARRDMCSVDGCSSMAIAWYDHENRPYCDSCMRGIQRLVLGKSFRKSMNARGEEFERVINRLASFFAEADVDDPFPGSPDTIEVPMADLYALLHGIGAASSSRSSASEASAVPSDVTPTDERTE
jgi:hypothetical protein